jgi:oligopeptidase B
MGRNFRLVAAPVSDPGFANWVELIPHRLDVMLEEVELFQDFYVPASAKMVCRACASPAFAETGPRPTAQARSPSPSLPTAHTPTLTGSFDTQTFRYAYQSLVTPASVYEYDVRHGSLHLAQAA